MKIPAPHEILFQRHPKNPILTAADWPYPAHTVFNPAATLLADGTTLLLCRVEDRRGHSHLCAARSANGIDGWVVDAEPTLLPSPIDHPEELWGIEDPRITFVDELGKYAVAYTAFGRSGPAVALALMSHQYPVAQSWLTAKVVALLLYIGLGGVALSPRVSRLTQRAAFAAALICVSYILWVARTRSPVLGLL